MLVEVPDDRLGHVLMPGVAPRLSRTPGEVRWAGQELGAATEDVLGRLLGLGADELAALRDRRVI